MPMTHSDDDRKRLDPYDPRTGATGNDDPNEFDDDEELEGEDGTEGDGDEPGS